jgi:hypothetical protein
MLRYIGFLVHLYGPDLTITLVGFIGSGLVRACRKSSRLQKSSTNPGISRIVAIRSETVRGSDTPGAIFSSRRPIRKTAA